MRTATAAAVCLALTGVLSGAVDGRSIGRVTLPSLDRDDNGPIQLQAILLLPDGPTPPGGFPAVVALHGCSGMWALTTGREDQLSAWLAVRAEPLLGDGYAVLFPDSFGSRGRQEVCTIKRGESPITPMRRRLDALGALAYLAERPDIDRERIGVIGWSHGGSTALAAINVRDREVTAFRARGDATPFFRAAVAYYPGCSASLRAGERWQPGVPTRIHIGELDDWTPPKACIDLGQAMSTRGEPLEVIIYPDSHHGFDAPDGAIRFRADVPNGVHPGQGVHVGANPTAREKSLAKVRAFLGEQLHK